MKNFLFLFVFFSLSLLSINAFATTPPKHDMPQPQTVVEDTDLKISGLQIIDPDNDVNSVTLTMSDGKIEVQAVAGVTITSNKSSSVTLSGTQANLNKALKEFTVKGNENYFGPSSLKIKSKDVVGGEAEDTLAITILNGMPNSQVCDWNNRPKQKYRYFGDYGNHISVGPVATYSLIRYNLADKEASFNAKSAGGGLSFRWYPDWELSKFGVTSIQEVPRGCRAQTEDLIPDNKVVAPFSFSPTFYVSQGENENDLETQLAFNVGFLNDLVSVGLGWNLSGENAGEWFLIIGPSFGFRF